MKKLILIFSVLLLQLNYSFANDKVIESLKEGDKFIFIRHALAPGNGDPENFDINNCETQRNLSQSGRLQSKKIGNFFKENDIPIKLVISSEWCRCKETALIAFKNYETENFLNSFYSAKFTKNRKMQMKKLKNYVKSWNGDKNLVLVTHYVVISEALNYAPSSGEIVIADKNFKKLNSIEINY